MDLTIRLDTPRKFSQIREHMHKLRPGVLAVQRANYNIVHLFPLLLRSVYNILPGHLGKMLTKVFLLIRNLHIYKCYEKKFTKMWLWEMPFLAVASGEYIGHSVIRDANEISMKFVQSLTTTKYFTGSNSYFG